MDFITHLNIQLDQHHLLKHRFYQAWNEGTLSLETLQLYAQEYYHHVAAFPRYLSGIHSLCPDIASRQVLLGNLIEEEQGPENHPELWKRFAKGLGVEVQPEATLESSRALGDGYFELTRSDYATGLGAIYAYERQTPEVAKSKIEGLKKHYGIDNEQALKFFSVHMQADEWHTQEIAELINGLSESEQVKVAAGAQASAKLLWGFLDGMGETTCVH